ncbi:OmpA family protein [Lonsdalea quercina]|uniref:Outer membrane protein OmpA n=1 Tax=Lonsdalea quercina TaxID=71657 RepID=A0A1H4FID9_9GAMM|nr:Outer membrane protein OmpA [Lonsdalea quercina]
MKFTLQFVLIAALALGLTACQSHKDPFTPEQVAALQSTGFKPSEEGWTLGLTEKVLFGVDQSTLTPQSRAAIKRVANTLSAVGLSHARMDGHSDNTGEDRYNKALSLRRAEVVADVYAVSANIPRSHIQTRGLGKDYPIASNATAQGRAQNRRVAIVITAP